MTTYRDNRSAHLHIYDERVEMGWFCGEGQYSFEGPVDFRGALYIRYGIRSVFSHHEDNYQAALPFILCLMWYVLSFLLYPRHCRPSCSYLVHVLCM